MKRITLLLIILLVGVSANLYSQATAQVGGLDNTFGNAGKVTTKIGYANSQAWSMAIQNDWSIVLGGFAFDGRDTDFAVARYKQNGTLDSTFGVNGEAMTRVGDSTDVAFALTLQPDGKILLGGSSWVNNKGFNFTVLRYNTNGTLDSTFGTDGVAMTAIGSGNDQAYCMSLQNDWSIVLGGVSFDGVENNFALARFTTNGALDGQFGNGGIVTTPMGAGNNQVSAMAIQSDWSIVMGGASFSGSNNNFALVRYDSTGTLDNTFNKTGKIMTPVGSGDAGINGLAIQPDGSILATGYANNGTSAVFALARYTTTGILDTSFAGTGIVTTSAGDSADAMYAVTVQPDGKILTAGSSYVGPVDNSTLIRYDAKGNLDQSFGLGGKVLTAITLGDNENYAVAIQPDGKIVTAGYAFDGANNNFALARYISGLVLGVIDLAKDGNSILIYPNPVAQTATLEYTLQNNEQVSIKLLDMHGRTVKYFITNQNEPAGDYKQPLDFPGDLASGSYIIAIEGTNGTLSLRIVK